MPFNTALSGLRAAQSELRVSGNNIANAATVGFKQSRTEFGDVYAASQFGSGANSIGGGVLLSSVSQQFDQGTINFTENSLDLAINGTGFFVLNDNGSPTYTRAGQFGVDSEGFIVNSAGAILRGNTATEDGQIISGSPEDLQLQTQSIEPRQTTAISQRFNLDASENIKAEYGTTTSTVGTNVGVVLSGDASLAANNYSQSALTVTYVDGTTKSVTVPTTVSASTTSAANMAAELNQVSGLTAVASTSAVLSFPTEATLSGAGVSTTQYFPTGAGQLLINGRSLTSTDLTSMAVEINELSGFSATLDTTNNRIIITNTTGDNIRFDVASTGSDVAISVQGVTLPSTLIGSAGATTILGTSNLYATAADDEVAIIGGAISITMNDTVATTNGLVDSSGAAGTVFGIMSQAQFDNNTFDVDDPDTYNHATSMTIYDSLGNAHVMTQYFVKEAPIIVGGRDNIWSLYIQVDGRNVDVNPVGTEASLTRHELAFNSDGSLNSTTESISINNWTPANADGTSNGAKPPSGVDGTEIGDPPAFSDFRIDVAGTTSFGGPFNVASIDQDGFSTGQLSSLEIADDGTIFARFTNGEARVLGQLLLARFDNSQGLNPTGNTSWTETFESGTPTVAQPGTSSLGLIQSGAVEESNVDLSSELVNLILAQRNFQASAKTIETANAITQTIINLR